jgi:hypothetical protein
VSGHRALRHTTTSIMPLVSLLDNLLRPARPFVIFQSSGAQTCLPLLRQLIARDAQQQTVLVCCLLYPPAALVQPEHHQNVIIRDRTADVPGFGGSIIGKVEAETMVNTGESFVALPHAVKLSGCPQV